MFAYIDFEGSLTTDDVTLLRVIGVVVFMGGISVIVQQVFIFGIQFKVSGVSVTFIAPPASLLMIIIIIMEIGIAR